MNVNFFTRIWTKTVGEEPMDTMTDTIIETKKGLKYIKYPIDVFHYYPAI